MWDGAWIVGLAFLVAILFVIGHELYWTGFKRGFKAGEECEQAAWITPGYGLVVCRGKRYHVAPLDPGIEVHSMGPEDPCFRSAEGWMPPIAGGYRPRS